MSVRLPRNRQFHWRRSVSIPRKKVTQRINHRADRETRVHPKVDPLSKASVPGGHPLGESTGIVGRNGPGLGRGSHAESHGQPLVMPWPPGSDAEIRHPAGLMRLFSFKGPIARQKKYAPDLIAFDGIIVELKPVSAVSPEHEAQVMNNMRTARRPVGKERPIFYWRNFSHRWAIPPERKTQNFANHGSLDPKGQRPGNLPSPAQRAG